MIIFLLVNMFVLGMSRLRTLIRLTAFQSMLPGLYLLLESRGHITPFFVAFAAVTMIIKGIVFPILLFKAIERAKVKTELEPYVGYGLSLLFGLAAAGLSIWISGLLYSPANTGGRLNIIVAMMTIFTGLFILMSRKKAITQVLGYIILENGIYLLGMAMVGGMPLLLEAGILLDVFVGVFIMGIAVFHINRQFDHIDVNELNRLKG